jgi:VanZ family protein
VKTPPPKSFPWREWTAAVLWLILIAIESTPWLSAKNTGHALYQLLVSFFGPVSASSVSVANNVLRKVGHVAGYGILSWLLFRAWRATLGSYRAVAWALSWSVIAFFMTAAVASLDEWHQTLLPSRTGRLHDVILDSASGLAVQILLFLILRKRGAAVADEQTVSVVSN